MADLPPYPGTPRWVKVLGIIVIFLILLIVFAGVAAETEGISFGRLPGELVHAGGGRLVLLVTIILRSLSNIGMPAVAILTIAKNLGT